MFDYLNFYFAAFGFCEYEDPEATLRCIRLLNEWRIVDKNLVVCTHYFFIPLLFPLPIHSQCDYLKASSGSIKYLYIHLACK